MAVYRHVPIEDGNFPQLCNKLPEGNVLQKSHVCSSKKHPFLSGMDNHDTPTNGYISILPGEELDSQFMDTRRIPELIKQGHQTPPLN